LSSSPTPLLILGSSGSIGQNTLDVVRHLAVSAEGDDATFAVAGLVARRGGKQFRADVEAHSPRWVALTRPEEGEGQWLEAWAKQHGSTALIGEDAATECARIAEYDVAMSAITGAACLAPTVEVAKRGKRLALANKEAMVLGGELVTRIAAASGSDIIPVDSEHSAIFQCLRSGGGIREVQKIILTASGGPFRETPASTFKSVTPAPALKHPTWDMGQRITIDSATMFNKALEIIEARYLFNVTRAQIDVVVHPQSMVHSLVEFIDGSVIAQLGPPDMRLPIQYAMTYPRRQYGTTKGYSVAMLQGMTFFEPDFEKFPTLKLGFAAAERPGTLGTVLNAADEVLVEAFLGGRLRFDEIFDHLQAAAEEWPEPHADSVDDILKLDQTVRGWVRARTRQETVDAAR
jgi:1-deoxy-D-xylulose-5-phosphate reductoisomerase